MDAYVSFIQNNIVVYNVIGIFILAIYVYSAANWFFNTNMYQHISYKYNDSFILFNITVPVLSTIGALICLLEDKPYTLSVVYVIYTGVVGFIGLMGLLFYGVTKVSELRKSILDNQRRSRY